MNKRQRNKHKHIDPIQTAFNVIAEHLANTNPTVSFFIEPSYEFTGQERFQLTTCNKTILVSKQVDFKAWREKEYRR